MRAPVDGRRAFDIVIVEIIRVCDRVLPLISSRRLQMQLLLIVFVAFAAAFVPLLGAVGSAAPRR